MKQITPILKKNRCRQILILCVCILTLTSCYDFDSSPNKIKTDYTFAIPIMDMTISVADFSSITNYTQLLETIEIPEGTPINMGERSYPFYIGEYSSSQTIEWLEPRLIIDTKDLPSNTTINIKIYTKNDLGEHSYFWLPNNYSITLVNTPVKVIETITNIDQFRNARTVFIDVDITYPTDVTVSQIINDKINIKFAIRFALKINL